ncbi:MAG: hypothetical protein U5R31_06800 [Acidimicrobiia bacterium]|nr:hypothetical protein [Acidimicrobiia bacterium]
MGDTGDTTPPRRRLRWWLAALVVAATTLGAIAVGATGTDEPEAAGRGSSMSGVPAGDTRPGGDHTGIATGAEKRRPCAPTALDVHAELLFHPVVGHGPAPTAEEAEGLVYDDQCRVYELGPPLEGDILETAEAEPAPSGRWTVTVVLREGSPGIDDFNGLAASCWAFTAGCPTGRVAVVLGDHVLGAPSVQTDRYTRDGIRAANGLTERQATALADTLG